MHFVSAKRLKLLMMCVLAFVAVTAGWYIYRSANAKPVCDCMFPNSKRYGVMGSGGTCRVVECEVKRTGN
jgi:hypothetical protein